MKVNEYGMTPISYNYINIYIHIYIYIYIYIYILILGIRGGLLSSEAMHGEYPCRAQQMHVWFSPGYRDWSISPVINSQTSRRSWERTLA